MITNQSEALQEQHAPVGVKPLEWVEVHGEGVETYEADSAVGIYRVFTDEDSAAGAIFVEFAYDRENFCTTNATDIVRTHGFPEAIAAAQADYERRIFSALQPSPVRDRA